MADVAVVILRVVAEIRDVAEDIKENDRQACRLLKRVLAIEPPVLAVREGTKLSSSESLRQLLATVEKIRNFLGRYARTSKFNRALKRKANADKFTQLGVILTEGMQALHLDVAVDAWTKEDASDRLADLENMVDMMEKMERSRTDNHAEVMGVLKVSMEGVRILRRACSSAAVLQPPHMVLPLSFTDLTIARIFSSVGDGAVCHLPRTRGGSEVKTANSLGVASTQARQVLPVI